MKLLMSREWITSPHEKSNVKMEKTEKLARGICLQLTCQLLEKDGLQGMGSGGGGEEERRRHCRGGGSWAEPELLVSTLCNVIPQQRAPGRTGHAQLFLSHTFV